MKYALGLFIALVTAGMTHILSLFALPFTLHEDAFSRLAALAPAAGPNLIHEQAAAALPFADPNIALAVCRYDLASGPFRVRTRLSDTFLVVVFADEKRGIFSSVSDRAATSGLLDVVVASEKQLSRIAALDDKDEAVEEIRVSAAHPRGMAIIKVLVDRKSARDAAQSVLADVKCESETLPE